MAKVIVIVIVIVIVKVIVFCIFANCKLTF